MQSETQQVASRRKRLWFKWRPRLGVLIAVSLGAAAVLYLFCGQPLSSLRRNVLIANSAGDKAKAYQALFRPFGAGRIAELLGDTDNGIAIQAAWEVLKRPRKRPAQLDMRSEWVLDPLGQQEFLGFLRSRIDCDPPEWWQQAITDVDLFPGSHVAFCRIEHPEVVTEGDGWYHPQHIMLGREDGKIHVCVERKSVTAEEAMLLEAIENPFGYYLTATSGQRSVIICVFAGHGFPFQVSCLETASGKLLWTRKVWATRYTHTSGPWRGHYADPVQTESTVYVFGAESHGMYLEAFDLATGMNLFRFCSSYWSNSSERW
jgi:hypothetical protein